MHDDLYQLYFLQNKTAFKLQKWEILAQDWSYGIYTLRAVDLCKWFLE